MEILMDEKIWTYPRIHVEDDLGNEKTIPLSTEHAHYFRTVLRRQDGNHIRLFNGRDGEWLATLDSLGKKSGNALLVRQTCIQPKAPAKISLFFAPIKKARMSILIEKAVELGVTDLYPTLTERTENRKLKPERIEDQIKEAAEQCERLEIPTLHPIAKITALPYDVTIHACIERDDERQKAPHISAITEKNLNVLVGPEGGFTSKEIEHLAKKDNIIPISLGNRIYRAETASIICLTHAAFLNEK